MVENYYNKLFYSFVSLSFKVLKTNYSFKEDKFIWRVKIVSSKAVTEVTGNRMFFFKMAWSVVFKLIRSVEFQLAAKWSEIKARIRLLKCENYWKEIFWMQFKSFIVANYTHFAVMVRLVFSYHGFLESGKLFFNLLLMCKRIKSGSIKELENMFNLNLSEVERRDQHFQLTHFGVHETIV